MNYNSDSSSNNKTADTFIILHLCSLLLSTFFNTRLQSCALILDDIADSFSSYSIIELISDVRMSFT